MKKYIQLLVIKVFVTLVCFSSCKDQPSDVEKELYTLYETEIIEPKWDSKAWTGPHSILLDGKNAKSDNVMNVFSKWNIDSIFFFFKVRDICLRAFQAEKDHPQLYLDDMVEVL